MFPETKRYEHCQVVGYEFQQWQEQCELQDTFNKCQPSEWRALQSAYPHQSGHEKG